MAKEPTSRRDKDSYNNMNKNSYSSMRCPHCAGPLSKEMETSEWTVPPLIRDSFSMIGSAVGGTTSAFYGFNHVMPIVRRWIKGPMWLHFLVGMLSTSWMPLPTCASGYAVGVLIGDKLHLNPVHAVIQLRPSKQNLKESELKKNITTHNDEKSVENEDVKEKRPVGPSKKQAPPVIVFSSACAGLAGGAVPAFSQLASSSYHAAISSSTLPPTASQDENMRKSTTSSTL